MYRVRLLVSLRSHTEMPKDLLWAACHRECSPKTWYKAKSKHIPACSQGSFSSQLAAWDSSVIIPMNFLYCLQLHSGMCPYVHNAYYAF